MAMPRTTWWLRVVGAFYLLLTLMNLYGIFVNPQVFNTSLPFPAEGFVLRAFTDAWLVFVLEMGALGAAMLYASRDPARSRALVLAIIIAEVFRGIAADAIWITRGYSAATYALSIGIHVIIIATGILFLRKEKA